MKYCSKCGKELLDEAVVCPGCGCAQNKALQNFGQNVQTNESTFGWAVLGFFIPLAGLILYLVWKQIYPARAKSAGKGALISFIISVVLYVIVFVAAMIM